MPYVTTTATPSTEIYYEDLGRGAPVVLIDGMAPESPHVGGPGQCPGRGWLSVHRV